MKSFLANEKWSLKLGLLVLVAAVALVYIVNIDGWLMHDDEGTDFYEAWRLAEGDRPGTDFLAEQEPLYLLAGSALVRIFGIEVLPLRLLSSVQVLLGLGVLSYAAGRAFGKRTGVLALLLVASSGMVYSLARLYRPDPMMLGWMMAGMGAALLAVARRDGRWWMLSGAAYGVAFMWKPFALFQVTGLAFYFAFNLIRLVSQRRQVLIDGLKFALPFGLIAFLVNGALHLSLDFYYFESLSQHASIGRDLNLLINVLRPALAYVTFFLANPLFLFVFPLWWLNRPTGWKQRAEVKLLLWQLAVPLLLIALTRPFYVRYMIFLVPVFAILLAWQMDLLLRRLSLGSRGSAPAVAIVMIMLLLAPILTSPRIPDLLTRAENGTMSLAGYVAENSQPDDLVLSDYAGINFFADRRSIYEASIVAGAQIEGGIVTGELLIERMEQDAVNLVLVHVEGGDPPPHQLTDLVDYDLFKAYLDDEFDLITLFDRNGQQIEVYARNG